MWRGDTMSTLDLILSESNGLGEIRTKVIYSTNSNKYYVGRIADCFVEKNSKQWSNVTSNLSRMLYCGN